MTPNKKTYRLSAFTMMDLLTGMVIMSIVVGIVFYLLNSTNFQVIKYGRTTAAMTSFNLMTADLNYNVNKADKIVEIPNGFDLVFENEAITYQLDDSYLIRSENIQKDTLASTVSHIHFEYVDPTRTYQPEILISAITIDLSLEKEAMKFYMYKPYDSQAMINHQILNNGEN